MLGRKKILSADDSRVIRRLIYKYASAIDFEVIEAIDGKDCIYKALKEKPDLIVLDVNMPNLNGQQVLVNLRRIDETKRIPVLMATSESRKQVIIDLVKKGANQYIIKPFSQETFYQKLQIMGFLPEDFDVAQVQANPVSNDSAENGQLAHHEDEVDEIDQLLGELEQGG